MITLDTLLSRLSYRRYRVLFAFLLCLVDLDLCGQNLNQVHYEIIGNYTTDVWIYTPPGYQPTGGQGSPILLSLHGGSGIVDDNNYNVIVDGTLPGDLQHLTPGRLIFQNKWNTSLPFIVVSPQLKRDPSVPLVNEQTWPPDLLDEVVEYVKANFNADPNRLYVTGISVGATGTWDYAIAYPGKVAAIMPMGGKGAKSYACNVKDVPAWVFHGQDDPLVPNRFSTDMVEAILDCTPAGKYIPHLTLNNSMDHVIWNPLFTGSGGYDIYSWLLKFEKGNDSNKAPSVFTGNHRMVKVRTGPIFLFGDFFDSDGFIQTVQWTQVGGSPSLTLQDTDSPFLKIVNPEAGVFTFRLTVTDDDGLSSSSDVMLTIQSSPETREVTGMILYQQDPSTTSPVVWNGLTEIGPMQDEMLVDATAISSGRINILAETAGAVGRMKWSINGDQHTRDNSSPFHIKLITSRLNTTGWGVFKGTYLVCATPYANQNFDLEGTSLCYKITVTDDIGIQKYYPRPGVALDLSDQNKWSSNPDGSGSVPANFTSDNQWFIVSGTETLTSPLLISGAKTRFVLTPGSELTVTSSLNAPIHMEGTASLVVAGSGTVAPTSFSNIGRSSRVTYSGTSAIPGNVTVGHLNITGAQPRLKAGGVTNVKGNLFVQPDLRAQAASSAVHVTGNVTIQTVSTVPYQLRFTEGYGDQNLSLPDNHTFYNLFIDGGCTVNVIAPEKSTITLGSTAGGGRLDVASYALLKLNGHDLKFENRPQLNLTSFNSMNGLYTFRTGKIELTGSTITVSGLLANPLPDTSFNLYPAKGKNNLKLLDVDLSAAYPGVKIWEPLNITEGVKLANGKILSRGNLTLVSTSTSTAYVAPVVGTGTIIGDVNVERMLMGGTEYRYLSFPVENFSVADLQEFFPVTGDFSGSTTGYSNAPSLYVYENVPSPGWVPFPSTSQDETFTIGNGYAVYVRDTPANKKLTFTGPLHIGPKTFTLADNPTEAPTRGWTLIGNPYAAPILWEGASPVTGWSATAIDPAVYIRDNQLDDFRFFDGDLGDVDSFNGMIATGQSFWIRSINDDASLAIGEPAKQQETSPLLFRSKKSGVVFLSIAIKKGNRKNTCFIKFNSNAKPTWMKGFDSMKRKGDYANISVLSSDNLAFAIKNLSDTICSQEARLLVETNGPGIYSIAFKGTAFDNLINKLYIFDSFTNAKTEVTENNDFAFEVTSDPASRNPNRFVLIIEKSNVDQPVITLQEGFLVSSVDAGIQWMLNGIDIDGATDQVFLPIEDGDYTVRTLGKNCSKVSEVFTFRVTGMEKNGQVKIYPNPASRYVNVSGLSPSERFHYEIVALNGVSVQGDVLHAGESGEAEIKISSLSSGFYVLKIAGSNRYEFKLSIR